MKKQLLTLQQLISIMDPELYRHFGMIHAHLSKVHPSSQRPLRDAIWLGVVRWVPDIAGSVGEDHVVDVRVFHVGVRSTLVVPFAVEDEDDAYNY